MFCLNVHVLKHPIWLTRWEPRTPTRVHPLDCQTRSSRSCGWYVLHQCPFDCGSGTIESSSCGIYTSRHTISSLAKTSPCYDSSCTPCVSNSAPQNCSHPLRQKVLCTNVGMFNSCHVTSNSENQGTRWASRQNLRCWASRTPGLPETTSFKWEKKWLVSNNPQKTIENHDKIHVFLEIVHNEKNTRNYRKMEDPIWHGQMLFKMWGNSEHGKASALAPYLRILPRQSTEQFYLNWSQKSNDIIHCTARKHWLTFSRIFFSPTSFFVFFKWTNLAIVCLRPAPHLGCPSDTNNPFHALALRVGDMECIWWR